MSLVTTKKATSLTETIKITVLRERLEDIQSYCNLENITQDFFFDAAIKRFFKTSKEWKQHKKQQK